MELFALSSDYDKTDKATQMFSPKPRTNFFMPFPFTVHRSLFTSYHSPHALKIIEDPGAGTPYVRTGLRTNAV